jgi:putative holliday junction resolvase
MERPITITTVTPTIRATLQGKRIGALDYGQKRIGFAIADELHVLASPRGFFQNSPSIVAELCATFERERLGGIIVGMPIQHDASQTPIMLEILRFIQHLQVSTTLPIYVVDEAYSSREAQQMMIASGKKKQHRQQKGSTDEVAAAIILREFLRELE